MNALVLLFEVEQHVGEHAIVKNKMVLPRGANMHRHNHQHTKNQKGDGPVQGDGYFLVRILSVAVLHSCFFCDLAEMVSAVTI